MKRALLCLALLMAAPPAPAAEDAATVVAARAIRARSVIGPADVALDDRRVPGAVDSLEDALGMEARTALHAGRPIMPGDLAPPALVERNGFVTVLYRQGLLSISVEGRALARGGAGERVRVMNLDSRATVTGTVIAPGLVEVY